MQTNHTADLYARLHDAENKLFKAAQEHREFMYHAGSRHAIVCGSTKGMLRGILSFITDKQSYEAQGIMKAIEYLDFVFVLPVDMFKTYDEFEAAWHHFNDLYAMYLDDSTDNSFKEWLDAVNVSKAVHGQG